MAKQVFLLFAAEDELLCGELEKHLAPLRAAGAAVVWHDRHLLAGEAAAVAIGERIDAADVILLLVTPDLLASEELRDEQVARALRRRRTGGARVVPVVVRPCVWELGTLSKLQPLPKNGQAVTSWSNRDEAWREVVRGVIALLSEELSPPPSLVVKNEVRTLEDELQAARSRKEKLVRVGASEVALRALDVEILELRRKLRERGQLAVGDVLANERYVLVELLGKGGFATVWKAHDEQTGKEVAVKVLHPQLMREEIRRDRFFRGARVMASLQHPGIVRVLEPEGHDRGFDYFVMELVRGGTLRDAIVEARLARTGILDVLLKVGDALAAAHAAGHVHRDVKPANILLDEDGSPRLTDFDLVSGGQTTGGTRTGVLGTIVYAAPEAMVNATDADGRADVYGLGMTGVFCYYGKDLPPSVMRDVGRVIQNLACSEEERSALARATEWEAEDRWPDVRAFCDALIARPSARPVPVVPMPSEPPRALPRLVGAFQTVESVPSPIRGPKEEPAKEMRSWSAEQGEDRYGRYAIFAVGDVPQRMRWIPPSVSLMGSSESEAGRDKDEGPQHEVELSCGFWLADTPCTQALWKAVMRSNPSRFRTPDRPVESVTWAECRVFLDELNLLVPGLEARLPTEAEWEYACRGGTTTATWMGDLDIVGENHAPVLDSIAWYGGNSGVGFELDNGEDSSKWPGKQYPHMQAGTHPVRKKQANAFGLHDMLGNVWEWCEDEPRTYTAVKSTDPRGPDAGSTRVVRGGSWFSYARYVRAAHRNAQDRGYRYDDLGFRFARSHRV